MEFFFSRNIFRDAMHRVMSEGQKVDLRTITLGVPPQEVGIYYSALPSDTGGPSSGSWYLVQCTPGLPPQEVGI